MIYTFGATVVGFSRSSFQSNGETVSGYNVYFTFPLRADVAQGDGVGSMWISQKTFDFIGVEIGAGLHVARLRIGDRTKFELVG